MGEKDKMLDDCQQTQEVKVPYSGHKVESILDRAYLSFMQSKYDFKEWFISQRELQEYYQVIGRIKRPRKEEVQAVNIEDTFIQNGAKVNVSDRSPVQERISERAYKSMPNPTANVFWETTKQGNYIVGVDPYNNGKEGACFVVKNTREQQPLLQSFREQSILHRLRILVKYTPNDQELGTRVRKLLNGMA